MALTPIKAIRAKCLDCCCGQAKEVRFCVCTKCSLYPYRMGHRPQNGEPAADMADDEKTADSPAFFEQEA